MAVILNCTNALSNQSLGDLEWRGALNQRDVTRLGASRLVRDSDGSIHLIEKTLPEVIGEKILRPFIDKISALTSYIFSYLPSFPSLPVANAEEAWKFSDIYVFSSQSDLFSCLNKHDFTGENAVPQFNEYGITQAMAESFAYQAKSVDEIDIRALVTLIELNQEKKLEIPNSAVLLINHVFGIALPDCAAKVTIAKAGSHLHYS